MFLSPPVLSRRRPSDRRCPGQAPAQTVRFLGLSTPSSQLGFQPSQRGLLANHCHLSRHSAALSPIHPVFGLNPRAFGDPFLAWSNQTKAYSRSPKKIPAACCQPQPGWLPGLPRGLVRRLWNAQIEGASTALGEIADTCYLSSPNS